MSLWVEYLIWNVYIVYIMHYLYIYHQAPVTTVERKRKLLNIIQSRILTYHPPVHHTEFMETPLHLALASSLQGACSNSV